MGFSNPFPTNHGGRRPGAGRPKLPDELRREPLEITLPEQPMAVLLAEAERLGLSPGEFVELLLLNLRRLL